MKKKRLKQFLGILAVIGALLSQLTLSSAQPDDQAFPQYGDGQFLAGFR
jgi:hypothetical protein